LFLLFSSLVEDRSRAVQDNRVSALFQACFIEVIRAARLFASSKSKPATDGSARAFIDRVVASGGAEAPADHGHRAFPSQCM
jgi:hypothetical protein